MKLCMNRNGRDLYAVGSTKMFWKVLLKEKCRGCLCVNAGLKKFVHGDT